MRNRRNISARRGETFDRIDFSGYMHNIRQKFLDPAENLTEYNAHFQAYCLQCKTSVELN